MSTAAPRPRAWAWSLRAIRWRLVLRAQHWGILLIIAPAAAVAGVSHWRLRPRERGALLYDASLSYPTIEGVAVPNDLAALYPWLAFLVSLAAIEGGLFWRAHSATTAAAGVLHWGAACLANFIITAAITSLTKPWVGRLRPDWLARCAPEGLGQLSPAPGGAPGLASPLSVGSTNFLELAGPCTSTDADALLDGRLSFPSGHAANTMCVSWFAALYMIWSLHLREGSPAVSHHVRCASHAADRGSVWARAGREALIAGAYAYTIFSVCIGWFIGLTRFSDNRHHMSDILGGFLLGMTPATFAVIKGVGQYEVIRTQVDAACADDKVGGVGSGDGSADDAAAPGAHGAPTRNGGGPIVLVGGPAHGGAAPEGADAV